MKKAEMFTIIVIIILSLVVLFGMTAFLANTGKVSQYVEWKATCKSSVYDASVQNKIQSSSSILSGSKLSPDIVCPTFHLKSSSSAKTDIMADIGKYMYDCLDIFNGGDVNILSWDLGNKNYCVICQNVAFDAKEKFAVKELYQYLGSTPIPNQNRTFLSYFYNNQKPDESRLNSADMIDTSKTYDIVFTYNRSVSYNNPTTMAVAQVLSSPITFGVTTVVAGLSTGGTALVAGLIMKTFMSSKNAQWQYGVEFEPSDAVDLQRIGCDIFPLKQNSYNKAGE